MHFNSSSLPFHFSRPHTVKWNEINAEINVLAFILFYFACA